MFGVFALVLPNESRILQYAIEPFPVAEPFRWYLIEDFDSSPDIYYEYENEQIVKKQVESRGILVL